VKDGSQSLEDYLDPSATAQYLDFTHEQYKKYVGDEFGKTIMGFRGDEPDYSIRGLPWTPKFFARFEQIKHYDIRPYVAAFLRGAEAKLTPKQLRARADYYDVFAEMFRDGFFKPQADWCAAHHLEYQVHLNHEEAQLQLAHSEGDFFRDMRYVQVPGIDSIWHQIWTDTISDFPRFASSAAHVYGQPRAFTESFAAYRPEPDVTMARYILNEQFVRGVNLVETMYYPATSTPNRGGPAAYMRDPAYPRWGGPQPKSLCFFPLNHSGWATRRLIILSSLSSAFSPNINSTSISSMKMPSQKSSSWTMAPSKASARISTAQSSYRGPACCLRRS
jgi:hypothetical protein